VHIIDLTYIEAGIHEESVAYVADQQNYYEQEGVHVAIRDGRPGTANGSGQPPRSD
jgi:NitT/TauT family transport system substrate-binding protein